MGSQLVAQAGLLQCAPAGTAEYHFARLSGETFPGAFQFGIQNMLRQNGIDLLICRCHCLLPGVENFIRRHIYCAVCLQMFPGGIGTVKGVVMDHQGETPGLGAEIAGDAHQAQYVGKQIFVDGELTGIIVKKGGATVGSVNEVDAISGGTKTCDGVTDMFKNSLANYVGYLKPAAAPINVEEPVELIPVAEEVKVEAVEVSNDKIEQSNE